MKPLDQAIDDFRAEYLLKAVFEADGHFGHAAILAGVHRNTISRILHKAGYDRKRVAGMVRHHRAMTKGKPVVRPTWSAIEKSA